MSTFDDNPPDHSEELGSPMAPDERSPTAETEAPGNPPAKNPLTYVENAPTPAYTPKSSLPEDLRVSWSWPHFVIFIFFAFASFIVVQTGLAIYYAPHQHLSQKEYEQYLLSKPQFLFGTNILWYAMIFLFLYVTIAVLRGLPFWSSLGWKRLRSSVPGGKANPWIYFFCGCVLAIFVALASSHVHGNENMPIQELFKSRSTALLLMGMAVLVAPLVEETVFRGYLYPLFAKSFGIVPGILLTGLLFGLMHGSQLAWSWGIVSLLVLVGIIFTFVRAHTGTVLASFLLHLGYNSMIAITSIVATKGFQQLPPIH